MNNLLAAMLRCMAYVLLRKEWHAIKHRICDVDRMLELNPEARAPLVAQQLLISGEDHRFFRHPGFDLVAMGRATWKRLNRRGIEGASTIEQQLVRVLTQRFERTVARKLREILLSSLVASAFKKEILPSVYLHLGYYGWNIHNFGDARRKLQRHGSCDLLTAARIVARLKYPEPRHYSITRQRQIELRTQHLIKLHNIHLRDGTYDPIVDATISNRCPAVIPKG
jgi:penicillin-binding protein 1A